MSKIITFEQDAREKIRKGIKLATGLIRPTMGPYGRNVILGKLDLPPYITNDGVSIARNVEAEDETENLGVWIVKEALSWASKKGGDSTTATAVFLDEIIDAVFEKLKDDGSLVSKKADVMTLKREIDEACQLAVEKLKAVSREISAEEIRKVALTAGEFEWIADIVSEIFKKIGKDGYVKIEEGNKTSFEINSGFELSAGYHSDYYINNDKQQCVLEDVPVLVTNNRLDTPMVVPLIDPLMKDKKMSVILIAPDFTKDLLTRLASTCNKTGFRMVALKIPTFDKDDVLIDIATLTGAKLLDKNVCTNWDAFIKEVSVDKLGKIDSATITGSKSILVGGTGDVTERVALLKKQIEETTSAFDKDTLEKRISFLNGGFATIKIGAETDFEREYFKLKMENAINSTQNALKSGVIKGGGVSLVEVSDSLPANILTAVLKAPFKQIQTNAGFAFDVSDSVIDSFHSVSTALKVACSQAGIAITMAGAIAFKKDEHKD